MVGGDGIGRVADDRAAAQQRVLAVMCGRNVRLQPLEGSEIRRHLAPLPRLPFGPCGGVGLGAAGLGAVGLGAVVGVCGHGSSLWSVGRGGMRGGLKQSPKESLKQDDGGQSMMRARRPGRVL